MTIILENHDYRYALEQMCIIFFPGEKYKFCTKKQVCEQPPLVISRICAENDSVSAETEIYLENGRVFRAKAVDSSKSIDKAAQSAIKMSFYRCARKFKKIRLPWGILTGIRPSKIASQLLEKGLSEREAAGVLGKQYLVRRDKRRLCIETAKAALSIDSGTCERDFSLYISIPFCPTRCDYCSFVSHSIEKAEKIIEPYIDTLVSEITLKGKLSKELALNLKSVYIGGGTPTTLSLTQLERVLSSVDSAFKIKDGMEYTVEAGRPDTITKEKLELLKKFKVGRISVNPQTLNDGVLAEIGRRHTAQDFYKAYGAAKDVGGFDVNVDLIAGLPKDSVKSFKNTLKAVCALEPENITVHTLSEKVGSNFRRESVKISKNGRDAEKMLSYSAKLLKKSGYSPYYLYRQKNTVGYLENTGFSMESKRCAYNVYMMEELHTVISCGAGAVTKLVERKSGRIERIFNTKYPYEYIERYQDTINQIGKVKKFYGRTDA